MAENEWGAKPTLRPLYKDFGRGRILGPNGIETGVHKFCLAALQRKPRASAVSLGSLAKRIMLWVVKKQTEMDKNEWGAKPTLRALYKHFGRGHIFGPNGIKTGVHKFFLAAQQRKPRASAVSLGSLATRNMLWVVEKRTEMDQNEWRAKPTPRPLYKDFGRGRIFGPNGIKTSVKNFFLAALQRKPRASAVSLGSLAMRNMLWAVEKQTKMADNEWDAKPTLRPLYKDFGRGRIFGPNGIETAVHNFFLAALMQKPRASAVSVGSLPMRNMLWVVEKRREMAENEWGAKPTLRPLY